MSLVKGFTDILTPVNLVPNCDFSRGGGSWPSTFNVSTYTSAIEIRDEWTFAKNNEVGISNIAITLDVNAVTISFHVDSSTGHTTNSQVQLRTTSNIAKKNYLYTCSCKYTVNTLGLEVAPYTSNTSVNYYRSSYDGKSKVQIYRTIADTYFVLSCIIPTTAVGKDIEITISDICLYEGMFCDPPYKISLDCIPSNQFAYINGSNLHIAGSDILTSVNKTLYERSGNLRFFFDVRNNTLGSTNVEIPMFYDYLNYSWKMLSGYVRIKFDDFGTYGRTYSRYYDGYFLVACGSTTSASQYWINTVTPGTLQAISSTIDSGETIVSLRKAKMSNSSHETRVFLALSNVVYRSSGAIAINVDYQLFAQSGSSGVYVMSDPKWQKFG